MSKPVHTDRLLDVEDPSTGALDRTKRVTLRYIKIEHFGALSDVIVGPFSPGLNVVFGNNESGKTTLCAFIGGVLFGWEESRGNRNTYRPIGADRAGSLFFEENGIERKLMRVRNADGLLGDVALVSDIDKATFKTMFSLTSDELRTLRGTTELTARLLTAGSGTSCSPARALAQLNDELASYTTRANNASHSIKRLTRLRDEAKQARDEAAREVARIAERNCEFHALEPERVSMNRRVAQINDAVEKTASARSSCMSIDAEMQSLTAELERLHQEEREAVGARRARGKAVSAPLSRLSAVEDRANRDKIESLIEQQRRHERAIDNARSDYHASRATYEAARESQHTQKDHPYERRFTRATQVGVSLLLFALFFLGGVPVFVHGRTTGSLTYMTLGLVMVLFSMLLAGVTVVLMFRPDRHTSLYDERLQDAEWVMLQDEKKLEACMKSNEALMQRINSELVDMGLEEAQGSLRRARALLDEAKDVRADMALARQRQQAASIRAAAVESRLVELNAQREHITAHLGLEPDATIAEIDAVAERQAQKRDGLLEATDAINRRYGELKTELAQAQQAHDFDYCKLRYYQYKTQLEEATQEYATLLVAKRMLEATITTWEAKSQPEVYAQASRLLSLMTCGQWVRVDITPEGKIQATDARKNVRFPNQLSMATCQQLYLALRIALLMEAENVGRSLPILADDILVNFDADRRWGAALALVELAQTRQVILFTCHEDVACVLAKAAEYMNTSCETTYLEG